MAPCDLPVRRASVCLTCGDKGYAELLIYCRNCRDSAVHHYCMSSFSPDDDNINWWCWDCEPKDTNANAKTSRKSERISSKRQKVLETRYHWKEKLNQKKRQVQINEVGETGGLSIYGHLSILDMETKLVNEMRKDQDNLEKKKLIPEIASYSEEHNELTKIDEPTFATKSTLPHKQENNMNSFAETQQSLLLKDSANAENEGETIDLQSSSLVSNGPNGHCTRPDKLCRQPSLEPDDYLSAEPVTAPIWRGWFNITEESETCVEILAHLSNKAHLKVSDAATAMPPMLDIHLLDKHVVWPKNFRITPPTASSIALYFFPASERDERVYDSLLDEVIERELALKVMIDDIELLIFTSCELPLELWRYNSKYYLWGVFRKKHHSHSSTESATSTEPSNSTQLSPPIQPNQSPLSMKSSQASNV